MPVQMRTEQQRHRSRDGEEAAQAQNPDASDTSTAGRSPSTFRDRAASLKDDLDDVLDEVDAILAENAEHLENFVQVSGE